MIQNLQKLTIILVLSIVKNRRNSSVLNEHVDYLVNNPLIYGITDHNLLFSEKTQEEEVNMEDKLYVQEQISITKKELDEEQLSKTIIKLDGNEPKIISTIRQPKFLRDQPIIDVLRNEQMKDNKHKKKSIVVIGDDKTKSKNYSVIDIRNKTLEIGKKKEQIDKKKEQIHIIIDDNDPPDSKTQPIDIESIDDNDPPDSKTQPIDIESIEIKQTDNSKSRDEIKEYKTVQNILSPQSNIFHQKNISSRKMEVRKRVSEVVAPVLSFSKKLLNNE